MSDNITGERLEKLREERGYTKQRLSSRLVYNWHSLVRKPCKIGVFKLFIFLKFNTSMD